MWMSYVACECVMLHLKKSCRIWMSHVKYEWSHQLLYTTAAGMSEIASTLNTNESCHIQMDHVTCEWVMSRIKESHHMWMSYFMTPSYVTLGCHGKAASMQVSQVITDSYVSYHIWMSHDWCICVMSHMNESWLMHMCHVTYEWVMTDAYVSCHIWIRQGKVESIPV